ncbi:hypothetical protein HPB52_009647 [Rhipicephalus sanguineus]|uniref:Uncharacterized protein n=1 Tax=Rhipicephalus sanguineus TaxID=34632 RepID=A0A9D4T969_RHISA|nr:hypothetical protein HPB52_009647 [Rhipicephalus sanguineus]
MAAASPPKSGGRIQHGCAGSTALVQDCVRCQQVVQLPPKPQVPACVPPGFEHLPGRAKRRQHIVPVSPKLRRLPLALQRQDASELRRLQDDDVIVDGGGRRPHSKLHISNHVLPAQAIRGGHAVQCDSTSAEAQLQLPATQYHPSGLQEESPGYSSSPTKSIGTKSTTSEAPRGRNRGSNIKTRILHVGRMPQLPMEDTKIVIRPRGGLSIAKTGSTVVADAATRISTEDLRGDSLCPNVQQILVDSTPRRENTDRYVRVRQIVVLGWTCEVPFRRPLLVPRRFLRRRAPLQVWEPLQVLLQVYWGLAAAAAAYRRVRE